MNNLLICSTKHWKKKRRKDNAAHAPVTVETKFWSVSSVYQSDHFRPLINIPNFSPAHRIMGLSEWQKLSGSLKVLPAPEG